MGNALNEKWAKSYKYLKRYIERKKAKKPKMGCIDFCDKKQRSGFCDKMSYNINI